MVGGGASCIAFVYSLERKLRKNVDNLKLIIDIYEPNEDLGRGNAYLREPEFIRLNRPPENMSIDVNDPTHFLDWIKNRPLIYKKYKESEFIARKIFGDYLKSVFEDKCCKFSKLAFNSNGSVMHIDDFLYNRQS